MPRISVTTGFITNSSSVVHHFPRELLEDPRIAAFIKAFEIGEGFVGKNLWSRSLCTSFAVTKEQKAAIAKDFSGDNHFRSEDFTITGPEIDVEGDSFVIIFGDEYQSVATLLCSLISQVLVERGVELGIGDGYN